MFLSTSLFPRNDFRIYIHLLLITANRNRTSKLLETKLSFQKVYQFCVRALQRRIPRLRLTMSDDESGDSKQLKDLKDLLESRFDSLETRLSQLESKGPNKKAHVTLRSVSAGSAQDLVSGQDGDPQGAVGYAHADDNDSHDIELHKLQDAYRALKDSVQKVVLPSDLKLQASKSGIKAEFSQIANVIDKSAGYVETAFKLLLSISGASEVEGIDKLVLCLTAHMNFLKAEKSVTFVSSTFDKDTGKLFRQFRDQTSLLSSADIQTLDHVVTLQANKGKQQEKGHNKYRSQFSHQQRGGYSFKNRGGRGGFFKGNHQENDNDNTSND